MKLRFCKTCERNLEERFFGLTGSKHYRRNQCNQCRRKPYMEADNARRNAKYVPVPHNPNLEQERWERLAEHVPEPFVTQPVWDYIRQLDCSFTLTDLKVLGFPRMAIQRVLDRLVKRGLIARSSVLMMRPAGGPDNIRHQEMPTWLYSIVEPEDEA